jgi:hypothetical protein
MLTVVLLPAVAFVPSEIPATVLFSVIALPLAMFSVVTANVAAPAVPVNNAPTCSPTVMVFGGSSFLHEANNAMATANVAVKILIFTDLSIS